MIAVIQALVWGTVSVFGVIVLGAIAVVVGTLVVADRADRRRGPTWMKEEDLP